MLILPSGPLAFRRRSTINEIREISLLEKLIIEYRVILLGVVRQEILSGIRYQTQYEKLKYSLREFPQSKIANRRL